MIRLIQRMFWETRLNRWVRLLALEQDCIQSMQDYPRFEDPEFEERFHAKAARACSLQAKIDRAKRTIDKL